MKASTVSQFVTCLTLGIGLMGVGNQAEAQSPTLEPWVDPLPVPPVATTTYKKGISGLADYYEINMTASQHQFHRDLGPATVWTYGQPGKAPVLLGPTIVAKTNRPVVVKWINGLPTDPALFPLRDSIDSTIAGADIPTGAAIPHLHGGHTPARFDGTPMQWWTADGAKGSDYVTDTFTYLNDQPASLIWYHDHTMGATRLKPYLGLAAAYLLLDDVDNGSTITVSGPDKDARGRLVKHVQAVPAGYGKYHLPLVLQDKQFNADGTLFYPTQGISPTHPIWVPEFFGDTPVVNGKAYPYLDAQPRRYRLRLLNGSQARFYNLYFNNGTENLPFHVIGSEGGLLPAPAPMTSLLVAPGERFDVILDLTNQWGKTVMMTNDAREPYPDGDPTALTDMMKINVTVPVPANDPDLTVPPATLRLPAVPRLVETAGLPPRDVVAKENMVPAFEGEEMVPAEVLLNGYHFMDPATDFIKAGTTETWRWINLTVDAHPMHTHLVTFQVVDRQQFEVDRYTADWLAYLASGRTLARPDVTAYLIPGTVVGPAPEEMGFKDTVKASPGYVTRIRATFKLSPLSLLDYNWQTRSFGKWVYHCHILEHEENDMMRPFEVVP